METLMAEYASDTDEEGQDIDSKTGQNQHLTESAKKLDTSVKRVKNDVTKQDDDNSDSSGENESDYFGLKSNVTKSYKDDNVYNAPTSCCSENTGVVNKPLKLQLKGQDVDVEIPNSDYWKDISDTDLKQLQEQNVVSEKRKQHPVNSTIYPRGVKRQFNENNNISTHFNSLKGTKTTERRSESSVNSGNKVVPTASINDQQKRKLFYIHPKITPLLHRTQKNRLPSKQEFSGAAHAGAINRIKWNIPNYSHLFITCSMDSTIKIWNIWSQLEPCVKVLSVHSKAVKDIDWSETGNHVLSCGYDKTAAVTDVEKGITISRLEHTSYVTCGKYHPVTPTLCVTGEHNQIQVWDTRSPTVPCRTLKYKDNLGQVQDLAFCPAGSTLFSCSDLVSRDTADRNLMAWDFGTGVTLSNQIYQERYTISRLKLHHHDNTLLGQSHGNYIAIFSLNRPYKMNKHKRFEGHKLQGYSLGFDVSPDGQTVYSGSNDGTVYCYNYQSGRVHHVLHTGTSVVMDVACHPLLPSTLAICDWNGMVQVWK